MEANVDELALTRKLVFTGHLNVPERKVLPGRVARASTVYAVVARHVPATPLYVCRNASIGSRRAARQAGYRPNTTPTTTDTANDRMIDR